MTIGHNKGNDPRTVNVSYKEISNDLFNNADKTDNKINNALSTIYNEGNKVWNYYVGCQYVYKAYIIEIQILAAFLKQFGYETKAFEICNKYNLGSLIYGNTETKSVTGDLTASVESPFNKISVSHTKFDNNISSTAATDLNVLSVKFNTYESKLRAKWESAYKWVNSYKNMIKSYVAEIKQYVALFSPLLNIIREMNGQINSITGENAYKLPTDDLNCSFEAML